MTSEDTNDDSTETTTTPTRRRALQAIGAGSLGLFSVGDAAMGSNARLGVGTAAEDGRTLDLSIWQTPRMATAAGIERDNPQYAQAAAKPYVKRFAEDLISPSEVFSKVKVRLRKKPVPLDTSGEYDNPATNIAIRLFDFDGWLQNHDDPSAHGNVLLDTPWGGRALGVGLNAVDDTIRGELTKTSVVDYGRELLKLESDGLREKPFLLQNNEIIGMPEEVAIAVAHELGHNLKLQHNEGASTLVHGTPAATPMTGPYLIQYGARGIRNACGQKYHEVKYTRTAMGDIAFKNDMRLLLSPSQCCQEHFATEARDLAEKQSGAAGFGPGKSTNAVPDSSKVSRQDRKKAATITKMAKPLHEKLTE